MPKFVWETPKIFEKTKFALSYPSDLKECIKQGHMRSRDVGQPRMLEVERSIFDTVKAGRLNKYECVQPMKGKYVGVIIPNKFENLIICELEAFQITGTLNILFIFTQSFLSKSFLGIMNLKRW